MDKTLKQLDDFLIDHVFQRFSWWFQGVTGKDNFWLAEKVTFIKYLSLAFSFVFFLVPLMGPIPLVKYHLYAIEGFSFIGEAWFGHILNYGEIQDLLTITPFVVAFIPVLMFSYIANKNRKRFSKMDEKLYGYNIDRESGSTERVILLPITIGFLIFYTLNVMGNFYNIYGVLMVFFNICFFCSFPAYLYFLACTPIKIREGN